MNLSPFSLSPKGGDGNPLSAAQDRIFIALFVTALVVGAAFQLGSVGYLLGFNASTLTYIALGFGMMSGNYWYDSGKDEGRKLRIKPVDEQLQMTAWAVVPIGLRWAMQMPFFDQLAASTVDPVQQLQYMAQVLGLWILVAVSEEAFRAGMLNAADLVAQFRGRELQDWFRILFANSVWMGFHFFQRPLDLSVYGAYMVWLFVAGLVMTYATIKGGMGAATLIHLIVNLTA
ncbi:MAG: CPBP family glutamic-type intramembrane protease [Candidatus Bathyarchaeota archaeon]